MKDYKRLALQAAEKSRKKGTQNGVFRSLYSPVNSAWFTCGSKPGRFKIEFYIELLACDILATSCWIKTVSRVVDVVHEYVSPRRDSNRQYHPQEGCSNVFRRRAC